MKQAAELIARLRQMGLNIATAESCSGGMLAAALTDIAGASEVFGYGLVTYSNEAKRQLLGVNAATLDRHGAVSAETAREMALGLGALAGADLTLAITGIAGPGGGSADKPVGLVFISAALAGQTTVKRCQFRGERADIRRQTVERALELALELLDPQQGPGKDRG